MEQREDKQTRRNRLALRRRAQWAHVKKQGPKMVSFKRYWRRSRYRNPQQDLSDMRRSERRALALSMWRTGRKIGRRAINHD